MDKIERRITAVFGAFESDGGIRWAEPPLAKAFRTCRNEDGVRGESIVEWKSVEKPGRSVYNKFDSAFSAWAEFVLEGVLRLKKTAAFFDIDGTISREGLISEMFKKMIKYELIDNSKWYNEVEPAFTRWDKRVGDYDDYLQKMVDIYTETVKNTNSFHIAYIAKKVIEQKGERVYTYSRERIRWHKSQGHVVIAISGSPIELVREMSGKYGMDDYRGTVYQIGGDGRYTGKITPMWDSESKRKAVLSMAEEYDLDLSQCYAYGDTNGDFSMMKLVGRPFAINPTRELLKHLLQDQVLREKVLVIVERKDVTYRMNVNTLDLI